MDIFDMNVLCVVGKIDRAVDRVSVDPVLEGRRRPSGEYRRASDFMAPRSNFAA